MAKAKKTAAEQRAQAKCAAIRGNAADVPTATATGSNSSIPIPSAPAPPPPDLPVLVNTYAVLQRCPARTAASSLSPPLQSTTHPRTVNTPHPASAPCSRPWDLLALAPATAHSGHPWASVCGRRQRRGCPHRHKRQQRALVQAKHEQLLWDRYHHKEILLKELRDACYAALGPLYQSGDVHGYGFCTPLPVESDHLAFSPRDEFECFPEILSVMIRGEEVLAPGPRILQERCDLAIEFQHCLEGLCPSIWNVFLVVHSFLVCTERHWEQQRLPKMQRLYIAGLHSRFVGDGG